MNRPSVLISNDDGYSARGIEALVEAFKDIAEVAVVAPERQQSGVGKHITLRRPLRARMYAPSMWAVDGTPTDCIYLAVYGLLKRKPDLVISGINHGPNLAEDVWYSGTAAAALEAASMGIRALAISHEAFEPTTFAPAAQFACRVAKFLLEREVVENSILNVNVPETHGKPVTEYVWTRGGRRNYNRAVTTSVDPRGSTYYWIGGSGLGHHRLAGSDCDALAKGYATVTPVSLDATDQNWLKLIQDSELPRA